MRLPGAGVGGDAGGSVALGQFVKAFCDLAEVEGVVVEPRAHEIAGANGAEGGVGVRCVPVGVGETQEPGDRVLALDGEAGEGFGCGLIGVVMQCGPGLRVDGIPGSGGKGAFEARAKVAGFFVEQMAEDVEDGPVIGRGGVAEIGIVEACHDGGDDAGECGEAGQGTGEV